MNKNLDTIISYSIDELILKKNKKELLILTAVVEFFCQIINEYQKTNKPINDFNKVNRLLITISRKWMPTSETPLGKAQQITYELDIYSLYEEFLEIGVELQKKAIYNISEAHSKIDYKYGNFTIKI